MLDRRCSKWVVDNRQGIGDNIGMSTEQVPAGIPKEDWAATPQSVRALVAVLLESIEQLQQRIAVLEERLNQNSSNSSKPPSSDPPGKAARSKGQGSGRQRGGQPGHPGQSRSLKPVDQVDQLVDLRPLQCCGCGALLLGEDTGPQRHQVTELPRNEPQVIEYRRHTLSCLACGTETTAEWPADMPTGSFGPGVQAMVGYLTGRMGLSQRDVAEAMTAIFRTELALGSVPELQQMVSQALEQPTTEAQTCVQQQPAVHVDETGWREQGQRTWLWVSATPQVAVFAVQSTRGAKGVQYLLGETVASIVASDRWSAYNWLDPQQRQLCWAHLKRDFQKLVDRQGASAEIGQTLLAQTEQLFALWYRVRDGTLDRVDFQTQVQPIQTTVQRCLQQGVALSQLQTRRTCQNLVKLEPALWTFVYHEGVEPTNNLAERCLRRAVLWRRRSFGTQSPDGSRFVERILTAVTTLRLQQRDVLDYLTAACAAAISRQPPPSLLPQVINT